MNEFSTPPEGHRSHHTVLGVQCACGWQWPTGRTSRQVKLFNRHCEQVRIDEAEAKP